MAVSLARDPGESVGKLLLRWREHAGLSRAEVDALTKKAKHRISYTRIRNLEFDLRRPTGDDLRVLADVYAAHYGANPRTLHKHLRDAAVDWTQGTVQTGFGVLIRKLRETAGAPKEPGGPPTELSLRELADRTRGEISHALLWEIEHGFREAPRNPKKLVALAKALGNTTVEELFAAAGYGRVANDGEVDRPEVEAVLARRGLTEDSIRKVEEFIEFVRLGQQRSPGRPNRRR